jgi:hypothetical protein
MKFQSIILTFSLLIAACGGEGENDPQSTETGVARYVEALCDMYERFEPVIGKTTESREQCEAYWNEFAGCDPFITTSDSTTLEACADWLDGVTDYTQAATRPDPACRVVWAGKTGKEGEECNVVQRRVCDLDYYCETVPSGPGLCTTCKAEAKVGEACSVEPATYHPCTGDGFCEDGVCKAKVELGATCLDGVDCISGYCSFNKCTKKPELGEACIANDLCPVRMITGNFVELPCCAGAFRSCIDGTCQDRRGTGAECRTDGECLPFHTCDEGECKYFPSCEQRGAGEPCTSDDSCSDDTWCTIDLEGGEEIPHCKTRAPLNGNCEGNNQCQKSQWCDLNDFICKDPVGPGESCEGYGECTPDAYCDFDLGLICQAKREIGGACTHYEQCLSEACDLETNKCRERTPPQMCTLPD